MNLKVIKVMTRIIVATAATLLLAILALVWRSNTSLAKDLKAQAALLQEAADLQQNTAGV